MYVYSVQLLLDNVENYLDAYTVNAFSQIQFR